MMKKFIKKLERMTLGNIEELIDEEDVEYLGEGIVRNNVFDPHSVTIKYNKEREIITSKFDFHSCPKKNFLNYLESILKANKLYISEVEYTSEKIGGVIPRRLKGKVYKDKRWFLK